MSLSRCVTCNEKQEVELRSPRIMCLKCTWKAMVKAHQKLDKIYALYTKRCEETVTEFTDGEEIFLADLSMILEGEDE